MALQPAGKLRAQADAQRAQGHVARAAKAEVQAKAIPEVEEFEDDIEETESTTSFFRILSRVIGWLLLLSIPLGAYVAYKFVKAPPPVEKRVGE